MRDPTSRPSAEERTRGEKELFLAVSVEGPLGEEGELVLFSNDRSGRSFGVSGMWDDTAVHAIVSGRGPTGDRPVFLHDRGTNATIFEGFSVDDERGLRGTLRGEGEVREVHSLPPRSLRTLEETVQLSEAGRTMNLSFSGGIVKKATYSVFAPKPKGKKEAVLPTRLAQDHVLFVHDDRGEWPLFATARGLVGRSPSGALVRGSFVSPSAPSALPIKADGLELRISPLKKGRRGSACEIDLDLPKVQGTPHDAEVEAKVLRAVIDAGAGFWPSGEAPPTLASFVCQKDPSIPLQIQSAKLTGRALGQGFLTARIDGYARFSDMGGVASSSTCLLLDGRAGEVIDDVFSLLPDEARDALLQAVNQRLRRSVRSQTLTRDDFYVRDELPSFGSGVSACVLPSELEVLVPLGLITKAMGGSPPLSVTVPLAIVGDKLPSDHRLAAVFRR